jgi:hypothetical protein
MTSPRCSRPHYKEYIYGYTSPESLDLNWCSPNEIHNYLDHFTKYQQYLFELLKVKKGKYSTGFEKGNYFHNAYPLVASNCCYAERMVCCGRKNQWNGTGSCQKWHLCSRCAYIRAQRALKLYLPAFNPNQFIAGTMSFEGYLMPENESEIYDAVSHWQTVREAIYTVRDEGLILGGYFADELKLLGFSPIRIIPHSHCIFHLESNSDVNTDSLGTRLASAVMESVERRAGWRALSPSTPSIALARIVTERHFANSLQYATKAIELESPYEEARTRDGYACLFIDGLNRELQCFLSGYLGAMRNRMMVHRIGTMHPASKGFVGKRWSRKRNEDFVRGYCDEQRREREGSDSAEQS